MVTLLFLLTSCKKNKEEEPPPLCNTVSYSFIENSAVDTTIIVQSGTSYYTDSLVAKFRIEILGRDYDCLIHLENQSLGSTDSIIWCFDNSTYSFINNPTHVFAIGNHTISLVVKRQNIIDSVSYSFAFGLSPRLYFPNVFTPNNDGINDFFGPCGIGLNMDPSEYSLLIKDANENIIFNTHDMNNLFSSAYIDFNSYEDGEIFYSEFSVKTSTGNTISGCTPLLMKLSNFSCSDTNLVFSDQLDPNYGKIYSTGENLCQ